VIIPGRGFGATVDRCLHPRRGQALPLRELAHDQGQARADPTLAAQ